MSVFAGCILHRGRQPGVARVPALRWASRDRVAALDVPPRGVVVAVAVARCVDVLAVMAARAARAEADGLTEPVVPAPAAALVHVPPPALRGIASVEIRVRWRRNLRS